MKAYIEIFRYLMINVSSLSLGTQKIPDAAYNYLVTFIGIFPVLYFRFGLSSYAQQQSVHLGIFTVTLAYFLITQFNDLQAKQDNQLQLGISLLIHGLANLMTLLFYLNARQGLFFQSNFTIMLLFQFLSIMILSPVTNSPTRLQEIRGKFGTQGFQNIIVYEDLPFSNKAVSPVDFGIVGVDSFRKYFVGDYFADRQSIVSYVMLPMHIFILLTIILQTEVSLPTVLYFSLVFITAFILGYALRLFFALTYAPRDLLLEIRKRVELTLANDLMLARLRIMMNLSLFIGALFTGLIIYIPVIPDQQSTIFDLANFDLALPFMIIFNILLVYFYRLLWKYVIWRSFEPYVEEQPKKKSRKNRSAKKSKRK